MLHLKRLQLYFTLPFAFVGVASLILVAAIAFTTSKGVLSKVAADVTRDFSAQIVQELLELENNHKLFHSTVTETLENSESGLEDVSLLAKNYILFSKHTIGVLIKSDQGQSSFFKKNNAVFTNKKPKNSYKSHLFSDVELVNTSSVKFFQQLEQSEIREPEGEMLEPIKTAFFTEPVTVRWWKISSNLKSFYIGLIVQSNIIESIIATDGKVGQIGAFVADESGERMDIGSVFNSSKTKLGSVFFDPECWIRCVVKYAHDYFGAFRFYKDGFSFSLRGEGGQLFSYAQPFVVNNNNLIVFSVLDENVYVTEIWHSIKLALFASLSFIAFLFLIGYWTSLRISRPLHKLNESAQRIGRGDWDHQIEVDRDDEIGDLAKSLRSMANRLRDLVRNLEGLVEERTSDYKDLIAKYAKANKELERSNATKDRFFSIIAHDLKSPFMALKGYSGIIEDSFDSLDHEQLREMVNKISVSSEEAHGLLENLLQWAIIQSGAIRVKWEIFNLQEVVLEVFDLMKVNAKVKSVTLESLINKDIWVEADRNMVSTVLRNIISNGIKFAKIGLGRVWVEANIIDKKIEIIISDNGVGINSEHIRKLFASDIYFTEKGTSNERGTGLGLGLCKEFVTMNRGSVDVTSKIGEGAKFIITLLSAAKPKMLRQEVLTNLSVLCVDDSEDNHNLIKIFLKEMSWELSSAFNGEEALEKIKQRPFDIVLMDINMPVLGGIETTRQVRAFERETGRSRCHVIAFTSSVLQEDIDAAISVGCDSYLVKPIKKQKLINSISRIVRR